MQCKCGAWMELYDLDGELWACFRCERVYDAEFDGWSDDPIEFEDDGMGVVTYAPFSFEDGNHECSH